MNSLAQVSFKGIFIEAYKGTRRKRNMKYKHIGHTTRQYGQLFFTKTISAWNRLAFAEAPSLAVCVCVCLVVTHSPVAIGNLGGQLECISMVAHRAMGNKIDNIMVVR